MSANPEDWSGIDAEARRVEASQYLLQTAQAEGSIKQDLRSMLNAKGHEVILDAGCGIGVDSLELAKLVPEGKVVGVDLSGELIEEAKARAARAKVLNIDFLQSDLKDLRLGSRRFDMVHCQRTLQHIPEPGVALANLLRVAKPGAKVLLYEPDQASTILYPGDPQINERILIAISDLGPNKGTMGRRLPALARRAGLTEIETRVFPLVFRHIDGVIKRASMLPARLQGFLASSGILEPGDLENWISGLRRASESGEFFAATLSVAVLGHAPA